MIKLINSILIALSAISLADEILPFGSEETKSGFLGAIYDLKQDPDNEETRIGKSDEKVKSFYDGLKKLIQKKFDDKALNKYFKGDRILSIKYLLVPNMPAANVPDKFSSDYIHPERLIIVYKGKIEKAPKKSFRFGGVFDDAMCVLVNGKLVFYVSRHEDELRYKPAAISNKRKEEGIANVAYGDYITLKKGDELTLVVAEVPGGDVNGKLLVQLKDYEYKKDLSKDPILHPFICSQLTDKDTQVIKTAGLETKDIPIFTFNKTKDKEDE